MASDDDFESSTGSTSSSTIEYKYAQIAVPAYELDVSSAAAAAASSANQSANSFLRLGSFPVTTSGTGSATHMSVSDDAPDGFDESLTLAKLIGNMESDDGATIASAETESDPAPGSDIATSSAYKGDGNYLLGFTDDTRYRDDGERTFLRGTEVDNTTANRQAETQTLLTKGGWWDHSDGNRVTTTAGDKIEVIQGNYKMVILGRQDPTDVDIGRTAITDFSGGHFQEQYTSPTPAIKSVEWRENDGVWTLFQDNGAGNVTTKFHGKQADYYTGSRKESYVGEDPENKLGDFQTPSDSKDPVLISKTWAQKIESYVGSVNKAVPHIYSLTYAGAKEDITFAGSVVATTTAASVVSTTAAASIISTNTAAIDVVSVTAAPLMLTLTAAAKVADIKIGTYFAFGTNTTHVRGHSTTIDGGSEVLSLTETSLTNLKTELNNYATAIAMEATNVGLRLNHLAPEVMSTSVTVNNLALQHSFF